jgi:regulation of enolase protein 1 (concanavalin A-like superfamily)
MSVPGLPFALRAAGHPPCASAVRDGALILTGAPGTDLFIDPAGGDGPAPGAGWMAGPPPDGDFSLGARVSVEFSSTYDAGVLLLYADECRWAKLCFEYSPQHRPTAVTVVTREMSDDSNSFAVDGHRLWLRITRAGHAWAFHASTDGGWWQLLRYFSLGTRDGESVEVGFLAQSPTGAGCTAVFDRITFREAHRATCGTAVSLRDGGERREKRLGGRGQDWFGRLTDLVLIRVPMQDLGR